MLGITDDDIHKPTRKRKKKGITFNEDEEVINPEDVDPSVGRFRNLIQTTVVPSKVSINNLFIINVFYDVMLKSKVILFLQRMRMEGGLISINEESHTSFKHLQPSVSSTQLYHDLPPEQYSLSTQANPFSVGLSSISSRLGLSLPNPAPEVEMAPSQMQVEPVHIPEVHAAAETSSLEPKKKKYAKEAWPGKKPMPTLLV